MIARKLLVALLTLSVAGVLLVLLWQVLTPGGWTLAKLAMLVGLLGTAPWTGLCLANGLVGFVRLVSAREPMPAVAPFVPPPMAVAIPVRSEELAPVLARVLRLLDGLVAVCREWTVAAFVLSDTTDPAAMMAEEHALAGLTRADRARVRYRRRAENTGFKAGNIMDFLDRYAAGST